MVLPFLKNKSKACLFFKNIFIFNNIIIAIEQLLKKINYSILIKITIHEKYY